jgi:tellurite resistance protein
MGLFSSMRSAVTGRSANDDIARAVLSIPLLVAASDGKLEEAELNQITNMCSYSPIFHAVGAQRTFDLAKSILTDLQKKGGEAVFQSAKDTLSAKLCETAICFAIRTALADGYLAEEEKKMLVLMGERLGVPEATFGNIFEVMAMLQRRAA